MIYIVRHGETASNAANLIQGHLDIPLNDVGRKQACDARQTFHTIPFTAVYSSDLSRAKETASILVEGRGLNVSIDSRFRERFFGPFEGRSMDFYYSMSSEERALVAETPEAVRARSMEGLHAIASAHRCGPVLIVAHGGAIKYTIAPMLGISIEEIKVGNLGYAKLCLEDGVWSVAEMQGITVGKGT